MKRAAKKKTKKVTEPKSVHSWRLCPAGEHWVRTHPMKTPPSKSNPAGGVTTRHGHCARNPTGKDQLYSDEIQEMAEQNFSKVKEKPCPIDLGFKNKGDQYDDFIAGWTKYWNDVFKSKASWEEAVMNYKGKLKSKPDDAEAIKQKKIFQKYFDLLEKCEKS